MLIEGNIFWVLGGIFVLVTLSKLALLLGCQSTLGAGPHEQSLKRDYCHRARIFVATIIDSACDACLQRRMCW
jgi:hypothetical protein